jgi:hypothetical protein
MFRSGNALKYLEESRKRAEEKKQQQALAAPPPPPPPAQIDGITQPGSKTVSKRKPEGLARFFDDSYLQVLQGMEGGKQTSDIYQDILREFKGDQKHIEPFLKKASPFLAGSLGSSDQARFMQDFRNVENPMQAFGQGAGMIGQGAAQSLQAGQNQLARSGLGRTGAMAGLAQRATQGAANQQSGLFTNLFQATQQRQSANAARAFDLQRQIAQMALGQNMTPRDGGGGQGISSGAAIGGGALSGAGVGAAFGPLGAVIGGVGGGLLGALS